MKQKTGFSIGSIGTGVMIGTSVSMAGTLIGTAACAALISSETIAAESIGYCAMVIVLLASMTGAAIGAGKAKKKRLYTCMLVAASFVLSLLAITALFFDGAYTGVWVTALVISAGSVASAFLAKSNRKQNSSRRSKIKRR
ncbi:MAG: hypothetical protein PUD38_03500 [Firmicutes bacterium]|nr:hypothetical protein [Bacillota bacterium]